MKPGLVSVTFRKLSAREIIELVVQARLHGIEWGGDVHVPPGDSVNAKAVGRMTRDAGLSVAAYGSYYRTGHPDLGSFEEIVEAAAALEAPIIRVWAGNVGSAVATPEYRRTVSEDGQRIAALAEDAGIKIALEWHSHTLSDTAESASALLDAIDHQNFLTYWQPRNGESMEFCLRDMEAALPRLIGVHTFHWDQDSGERHPLERGVDRWPGYLRKAAAVDPNMYSLLEFVADESPEQFLKDAVTLRNWLADLA